MMLFKTLPGKQIGSILVLSVMLLLLNSCARNMQFLQSAIVPGAEGKARVKKDNNGNHSIQVKIKHLIKPDNLTPAQRTYVVWMESNQSTVKNLGQLRTSKGLFSKSFKGSLNTVSPFDPRRIFITAEADGAILYPYGTPVLTTGTHY